MVTMQEIKSSNEEKKKMSGREQDLGNSRQKKGHRKKNIDF